MKSKRVEKQKRNHYSEEFKKQAVFRCEQEGVAAAARDLGLPANMLRSSVPGFGISVFRGTVL